MTVTLTRDRVTTYHPDKPLMTAPGIVKEYSNGETRMYHCDNGKDYVADVYDRMFVVKKGNVKSMKFKGSSPDGRVIR